MTKKQDPRGHHGSDFTPDRGRRLGTPLQETRMSGPESGRRYSYGRSDVWDSIIHQPHEYAKEVGKRRMSY